MKSGIVRGSLGRKGVFYTDYGTDAETLEDLVVTETKLGGKTAHRSSIHVTLGTGNYTFDLTTYANSGKIYHLFFWGFEENMAAAPSAIQSALDTIALPGKAATPSRHDSNTYTSNRLRCKFSVPTGSWRFTDNINRAIGPIGSSVRFRSRRTNVLLLAMCPGRYGAERASEMLNNTLQANLANLSAKGLTKGKSRLDGHECEEWKYHNGYCLGLFHNGYIYIFIAEGTNAKETRNALNHVKANFKLLP